MEKNEIIFAINEQLKDERSQPENFYLSRLLVSEQQQFSRRKKALFANEAARER